MTRSDLSIVIFGLAITLFVLSQFAKRAKGDSRRLKLAVKVLSLAILGLSAVYFYQRFFA